MAGIFVDMLFLKKGMNYLETPTIVKICLKYVCVYIFSISIYVVYIHLLCRSTIYIYLHSLPNT